MYFKLQKNHEQFSEQPEPIQGLRVRQIGQDICEAEIALCFQYDAAAKVFNLYAKRLNKNEQPRYDLLTTAKLNTVWCIEFEVNKQRRLISAVLSNPKGEEYVFAMPYRSTAPNFIQTILPSEETPDAYSSEPVDSIAVGPVRTLLNMWHEFRARKKKVAQARRAN